jgi:hypothetical protein
MGRRGVVEIRSGGVNERIRKDERAEERQREKKEGRRGKRGKTDRASRGRGSR